MSKEKKKNPVIGLVGILLLVVGIFVGCNSLWWGVAIGGVGFAVFVYAMLTGNLTLFG